MTPTDGIFSTISLNPSWALKKGLEVLSTERKYLAVPLLLTGYTSYHSFVHLSSAIRGRDSTPYRAKLREDAFSTGGLERIQLLARSLFGSISLIDRAREVRTSLGYLAVSTLLLYSMHTFIKDTSNNNLNFYSTIGGGGKEIFPDKHSHEINVQALKTYKVYESDINKTLVRNPFTPKLSKNTEEAVKIVDHALLPQDTPVTGHINKVRSTVCSLFASSKTCAFGPPSTETMNAQGIKEACAQTRATLYKLHPTDYPEKAASHVQSFCDWTWGNLPFISQEGDCAGLKANLHNQTTTELTARLSELDQVCEIATQRAVLQGRAEYPTDSLEGYNAYKNLYYKIVSPEIPAPPTPDTYRKIFSDAFSTLYNKTLTPETATSDSYGKVFYNTITSLYQRLTTPIAPFSSTVFTAVDQKGQTFRDFLEFSNNFPLSSQETNLTKLTHYSEVLREIVPRKLKELSKEEKEYLKIMMPILREATSSFLGISPGFSKDEFSGAFNKISKAHHNDRSKKAISVPLFAIANQLNAIFGTKGSKSAASYEHTFGSSLGDSIYSIPLPDRVVIDLWEGFSKWYNASNP